MLFNEMLSEVPYKYFDPDYPERVWEITDVKTLLDALDLILLSPPPFTSSVDPLIGAPINALLVWPMATTAGFAVFLKENVNEALKNIIMCWGQFLRSPESASVVGSWIVSAGTSFADLYECDPTDPPNYGFVSWDKFFIRQFRKGVREVAAPDDENVIVSAAESTPFQLQSGVNLVDKFWAKGQPYSLTHMLNGDSSALQFVGGTVYQAYLSADSYHRWHAPVSGTITKVEIVPGAYYSEPVLFSFKPDEPSDDRPDPGADTFSQGYISAVAARGLIWIQADNEKIGLMCMIMIGMAEISTIDVTMPVGQHFDKGDEIGMFHFGGSTHCLIFGPQVELEFVSYEEHEQLKVKSLLATVKA